MTNVRQLDLSKHIIDVKQVEGQSEDEAPLYKVTYIDGTWSKFYVEVIDETPSSPEEFTNSIAPTGRVELP